MVLWAEAVPLFHDALNRWFRASFFRRRTMNDCDYMRLALTLAERGVGWVSPNPLVGAVLEIGRAHV